MGVTEWTCADDDGCVCRTDNRSSNYSYLAVPSRSPTKYLASQYRTQQSFCILM